MHTKQRLTSALLAGVVSLSTAAYLPVGLNAAAASNPNNTQNNVVEYLDRGICAVNTGSGMLVSWRFLANDPDDAVFKLYRGNELIYTSTEKDNAYSRGATCFLDKSGSAGSTYKVECYSGSTRISSDTCSLLSGNAYFDVKLDRPGSQYTPNDMSVGDVDGDGVYELFLKWDPSNSKDNSQKGKTDKVYIDCYRLDGTKLWRIDLGVNIRAGAHYTQFYVADFDLDGKAEMCCKTADGTVDGTGKVIGDGSKDYRDSSGFIITGPEYYTLFDGATGAALDTVNYEPGRGDTTKWGKTSDKTNRVDRFWGTTAYLDGIHPCVVTGRGYYGRMTATAYTVENKKLKKLWTFDTGTSSSSAGYGDGNHNSMAADVDGDGKQEIITGSTCIDDNGTLLWNTNQGHGDALHIGDLDPDNPGLEAWICHEDKPYGVSLVDCDTGKIIFHNNGSGDTGRCCADNVWAGSPGAELWGNKESDNSMPVKNAKGETLSCRRPAINFLSYWDGDLEREILDGYTDSPATISKMNDKGTLDTLLTTDGYYTCNTTKGTPCLSADIFGDWREELIVRKASGDAIRIYCTTYDTDYRVQCLMHDPQYRTQVASQNTAYNQPPHTSFFLGTGYEMPERSKCTVNGAPEIIQTKPGAEFDTAFSYTFQNVGSGLYLEVADGKAEKGSNVQQGKSDQKAAYTWTLSDAGDGYYYIYSTLGDGSYCIDLPYGSTDNATSIGLWTNDESDARKFKFINNGDGTYTITTKVTSDESCFGVAGDSKEKGADVVQWTCTDNDSQKWYVRMKLDELNGEYIRNFDRLDTEHAASYSIESGLQEGALLFGDRDVTYTAIPSALLGAEYVKTPCDAKGLTTDAAEFTVAKNCTLYVALDSRMTGVPAFLNSWTKTDLTISNNKDVVFNLYSRNAEAGEQITLGGNGQSSGVVNYTVFAVADTGAAVKGDVNNDGTVSMADLVLFQKWILAVPRAELPNWNAADLHEDGKIDAFDLCLMKRLLKNQ